MPMEKSLKPQSKLDKKMEIIYNGIILFILQ